MNKNSEQKLLNEVSNYFGIPKIDVDHLKDINGTGTNITLINTAFELEVHKLLFADIISKTFNKLHRSNYIDNYSFMGELETELKNAGVPKEEIEKSIKAASKVIKEYGDDNETDHGVDSKWLEQYQSDKDDYNSQVEFKNIGGKEMKLGSA